MSATERVRTVVNGHAHEFDVEPRLLLVHYLRDVLGLTAAHIGCDTTNCGACTVLLDGEYALLPPLAGPRVVRRRGQRTLSGYCSPAERGADPFRRAAVGSGRPRLGMTPKEQRDPGSRTWRKGKPTDPRTSRGLSHRAGASAGGVDR